MDTTAYGNPKTVIHVKIPKPLLARIRVLAAGDRRTVHNWLIIKIEDATKAEEECQQRLKSQQQHLRSLKTS